MQLAIIKKKQCDAKALIIVEQLLEPTIDRQWLLDNVSKGERSESQFNISSYNVLYFCS